MKRRIPAKPLILLACVFASLSSIFIKSSDAPSVVLVFYRVTIAALLMLPYILLRCRNQIHTAVFGSADTKSARGALLLSALSGVFLGIHFYCYFKSLTLTGIAASVVIVNTEVFFVAAAMLIFFSERIPAAGWCGIVLAFAGSVIIALADSGLSGDNTAAAFTDELAGDCFALGGAAAMAVYTMLGKVCRRSLSTAVYTFIVYAAASVTTLIMTLVSGNAVFGYAPKNFLIAAALAVFCTLLGHSIFSWGLKFETPSFISMVKLTEPLFASLLGIVIFTEIPRVPVAVGGIIVIAGICIYTRSTSHAKTGTVPDKTTQK